MKACIYFLLLSLLIFITFNCGKNSVSSSVKPDKVRWIENSSDSSVIEKGIDAIPEGDKIHLEWMPDQQDIVAFFHIYRSSIRQGPFSKIISIESATTFYDDPVPSKNVRYYYYVLAVSDDGAESTSSDTINYKLVEKAQNLNPVGLCDARPVFQWRDPNHVYSYIIRVMDSETKNNIWIYTFQDSNFGDENKSIAYNTGQAASLDSLIKGKEYQWRIDIVGSEKNSGSESQWIPVQIQ
jgi:hypothetical protein